MQIHRLAERATKIHSDLARFPAGHEYDELRETARSIMHEVSRRARQVPDVEFPLPQISADSLVVHARSSER